MERMPEEMIQSFVNYILSEEGLIQKMRSNEALLQSKVVRLRRFLGMIDHDPGRAAKIINEFMRGKENDC